MKTITTLAAALVLTTVAAHAQQKTAAEKGFDTAIGMYVECATRFGGSIVRFGTPLAFGEVLDRAKAACAKEWVVAMQLVEGPDWPGNGGTKEGRLLRASFAFGSVSGWLNYAQEASRGIRR